MLILIDIAFFIEAPLILKNYDAKNIFVNCLIGVGAIAAFLAAVGSLDYQRTKDQKEECKN